jgi:hypothetical protein
MNKRTQDTIGWAIATAVAVPISALALLYAVSFSWASFGPLGLIFAGIALALAGATPYTAHATCQCWRGNEEYSL